MPLLQKNLFNSPYAGVFSATNDKLTFLPPGIPEDDMDDISQALSTEIEIVTVGGSSVLGTLIAMNNNGFLISNLATSLEIKNFSAIAKKFNINFDIISDRSNAVGNNFLINDKGGFCNERLGRNSVEAAESVLEIKITPHSLNKMDTLGMIGCVTNKGGLCHPEIGLEERKLLKESLQIVVMDGTVNFGMPLVGAGIIATSEGAVCGRQSTGVELGRIEEALILF